LTAKSGESPECQPGLPKDRPLQKVVMS
jgi:hypothetical protein